ncbi:hypothetical protein ACE7GA_01430 [Roseomonas sp. CCTCC AB2023176]|uniref:hypothetical protein n=1 Tax=Roseomonas sp. CCTCC AB2023176 TaxID=3342640 RepID=UPI0035DADDB5
MSHIPARMARPRPRPIHIGEVSALPTVREHLADAASARRAGDLAAANAAEEAALLVMRATLMQPAAAVREPA